MSNHFRSVVFLAGLMLPLTISQTALALPLAATAKPDLQVSELAYFQGNWLCTMKPTSSALAAATYTWRIKRELNDFWYIGQLETSQKLVKPREAKTHETMGYNTITKKFGRTVLTNDGGFANLLSDGWDKDALTWEGSIVQMGQQKKQGLREVIARKSNREFTSMFYTKDENQKEWQLIGQQTCQKSTSLFQQK
jgi:Protein of unknown function (DUF1579)